VVPTTFPYFKYSEMKQKEEINHSNCPGTINNTFNLQSVYNYNKITPIDSQFLDELVMNFIALEEERTNLLDLANEITKVREKHDLIKVFSSRIKELFYFKHSIVTLIDTTKHQYSPFLLDPASSPLIYHKDYQQLVDSQFSLEEPFIKMVLDADGPISFLLRDVMDLPGSPAFLKANFEVGMVEILMTPLKNKSETIGFIHIYSERKHSFTGPFRSIMKSIAPHLANSVANIIVNEKRKRKEEISNTILELGHEMVKLKDKTHLLRVLNKGLKKLIPFSHSLITISNSTGKKYCAFLVDSYELPKNHQAFVQAIGADNSVDDEIYGVASLSYYPVVFDADTVPQDKGPIWYQLNCKAGTKEIVIKILPNGDIQKFSLILFSDIPGTFSEEAIDIIETISGQLSSVARNLLATEAIAEREKEKSFLLDFSTAISSIRTKEGLKQVISRVLQGLLNTKLTMLRLIDDDGSTLSPYMYDEQAAYVQDPLYQALLLRHVTVEDEISARVLGSVDPIIFNIQEEVRNGNEGLYIQFWRKMGLKSAYGAALRIGNLNFGILWLMTNETNLQLLKGISSQISIAIFNIRSNEKLIQYKTQLEMENHQLHEQIKTIFNFSEIVGNSEEMQKVYKKMNVVAPSNSTVIILGETGTGKELIARAIHSSSPRKNKNMIKVNCTALPAHLIESELFGHEKGAFTGAAERRIGKFELANDGTIFLDEIGELPLALQVKLLRVIQEREFERLGGSTTIKVDVRIVAATNRDLQAEVNTGRFRQDLFYRLHVFPITLPSLRHRVEDIIPLANYFLQRFNKKVGLGFNGMSEQVIDKLKAYSWPGNVRELEHLIERSVLLNRGKTLTTIHIPGQEPDDDVIFEMQPIKTMLEMERQHIINILRSCRAKIAGNGGAADLLEIPPSTLHSKIKKLRILKKEYLSVSIQ